MVGDAYSAEWCSSAWRREGITYLQSELNASELYIEALPAFTRGLVSIPDHAVLLRELRLLERSPTRMGKEQVTHPRGVNDDHANVVCAVLHNLSSGVGYDLETLRRAFALDGDDDANRKPRFKLVGNSLGARLSHADRTHRPPIADREWGAASLPVTARAEYLEQVVAQLSSEPIDADVRRAVEFVLDSAASIFRLGDVQ